jgi:hypothetical protein
MWFLKRDWLSWKYEIRMITRHIAVSPSPLTPILLALPTLRAW